MTILSKHEGKKVFLVDNFLIKPGILTLTKGDWREVVGADNFSFFKTSDLVFLCVIADIPYIYVDNPHYVLKGKVK